MGMILKLFVIVSYYISPFSVSTLNAVDIDAGSTILWGPGLDPENITMRARYIFIQLVDKNGNNVTESPGKKIISSHMTGKSDSGTQCRIWSEILDCKDGSFILRYNIYNTCFDLKIEIKIKGKALHLKQATFKGPVYEEECYCPSPSFETWSNQNHCPEEYSQILQDLEPFPSVDFDILRDKIISRYNKPHSVSICHYVIKSNEVYRSCYGEHVGFKTFVDKILLSLTRKMVLPDVEFFMNLGDWPLVQKSQELYPIISWCGSDDSMDIVVPTYEITQSSIEAMGSVSLDMLSVQGNTKQPWSKKVNKVFWRGRDSRRERLDLIDLAKKSPQFFNVSITKFFFFRDKMDMYGPEQKHTSFFDFFEFKYQLNIDGTVAAYRFPFLMAGDSLVFKQNSKYYEHFYKGVEDGMQFISIKSDLSDLIQKVQWALDNDADAHDIAKRARQYVRDNLMPQDIFCYYAVLINEWSRRLKNTIEIQAGMEHVDKLKHECNCLNFRRVKKEEL
ncbi:hypothetical protein QAD02_016839 [Eretmocerus hayati]|uniref:Uncharacterized protein n=1 Tax=Eretmocerus hayati TaxID=131215 RepID=A0ACC2PCM4_9HYME|nr:hypothetical protein QAD02_016839 [Eretmocerus hayati]